jgi:mRNA interferase RelE/StbE
MAAYSLLTSKRAERDLDKIRDKSALRRIVEKIDALQHDPRPPGVRKLMGSDMDYRIRIGDYRVVYQINDRARTVLICGVGDRKDIYRGL